MTVFRSAVDTVETLQLRLRGAFGRPRWPRRPFGMVDVLIERERPVEMTSHCSTPMDN